MYNEELLERNLHPEFKGALSKIVPIKLVNSSCGDELLIYLKIVQGKVTDGRFQGVGCAISLASADCFIASIKGKTVAEAKKMAEEFKKMILGEERTFKLGEAEIMECVSRMPARVKCAELTWKSLEML